MIEIELRDDGFGVPKGDLPSYVVGVRRGNQFLLHPLEILYLVLEEGATITFKGMTINSFQRALQVLLKQVKETCREEGKGCRLAFSFWSMFTTYYNLRRRGRKVLPEGRREGTLIEIRKGVWWAEYLVLEEGVKVPIRALLSWIDEARANDLKSIIAIVDRNGSVTYYEAARVEIRASSRSREEVPASRASASQKGT